jgi:hypothetical protein
MIFSAVYNLTVISNSNAFQLALLVDIAFVGIFITRKFFEGKTILDSLQFWLKHPFSIVGNS